MLPNTPNWAQRESRPTKTILLAAWQSAADLYSKAVAELSRQIGRFPKIEYERWSDGAEQAHQSLEAQANLEAHINDHGCDGDEAAA